MGLCRERLSVSPDLERPVSASQQQHINGGGEAEQQSQSRQQGPSCPSEGCPEGQKENSKDPCEYPRPAPFAPSLLGEMNRAFSEANLLSSQAQSIRQSAVKFLDDVSGVALLQIMMQSPHKGGLLRDCLLLRCHLAEDTLCTGDGMASQLSVWQGRTESIASFLKQHVPQPRCLPLMLMT